MRQLKGSLTGKVALVTGAGSGIGKAAAKILGYAGAKVAALGRSPGELEETLHDLRAQGGEALELRADISDPRAMEAALKQLGDKWGRLDIVVANAGVNGVWAPIEEITPEDWLQTLGINLYGTFLTLKYAAPLLKAQGGSVVVTASVNGTRIFSNTGATAYSCSKAGQVALVKMLAVEWGRHKVRVNVICPGAIETNIDRSTEQRHLESIRIPVHYPEGSIPLTRDQSGTSGQVAELIWFLASDFSTHITGTEVYIDGAQSLLQG